MVRPNRLVRLVRRVLGRSEAPEPVVEEIEAPLPEVAQEPPGPPQFRRYLSGREGMVEDYLDAARDYVQKKTPQEYGWLYCKPYERQPGNRAFFNEMYQVLNLIQAMNIPFEGRVLEVGSGPGWVSEILMSLGFEVHGLEPCEDMIKIAEDRVSAALDHWRIESPPDCYFYRETLEACALPSATFDGVLFHAALHHVIDERRGLEQCFRLLKPGGVLGVTEAAWEPGNRVLEAALDEEMARFGTLENPFTREYLDFLLAEVGFENVQRFHAINGFIPEQRGNAALESLADLPAAFSNNLIAEKVDHSQLTTRNHFVETSGEIYVLGAELSPAGDRLSVNVELANTGKTTWLAEATMKGWVTLALRTDPMDSPDFVEFPRHRLPYAVAPGDVVELIVEYELPADFTEREWFFDLVNEEVFWFSSQGSAPTQLAVARTS